MSKSYKSRGDKYYLGKTKQGKRWMRRKDPSEMTDKDKRSARNRRDTAWKVGALGAGFLAAPTLAEYNERLMVGVQNELGRQSAENIDLSTNFLNQGKTIPKSEFKRLFKRRAKAAAKIAIGRGVDKEYSYGISGIGSNLIGATTRTSDHTGAVMLGTARRASNMPELYRINRKRGSNFMEAAQSGSLVSMYGGIDRLRRNREFDKMYNRALKAGDRRLAKKISALKAKDNQAGAIRESASSTLAGLTQFGTKAAMQSDILQDRFGMKIGMGKDKSGGAALRPYVQQMGDEVEDVIPVMRGNTFAYNDSMKKRMGMYSDYMAKSGALDPEVGDAILPELKGKGLYEYGYDQLETGSRRALRKLEDRIARRGSRKFRKANPGPDMPAFNPKNGEFKFMDAVRDMTTAEAKEYYTKLNDIEDAALKKSKIYQAAKKMHARVEKRPAMFTSRGGRRMAAEEVSEMIAEIGGRTSLRDIKAGAKSFLARDTKSARALLQSEGVDSILRGRAVLKKAVPLALATGAGIGAYELMSRSKDRLTPEEQVRRLIK